MAKLYLCEDRQTTLMLRKLMAIDAYCETMLLGFRMPKFEANEKEAVEIVNNYAERNIKELLKKCTEFASLSKEESAEESDALDSMIIRATLGTCCVLAEESEMVLEELQRLGKCKTIQETLKTNKNVIMII